MNIVKFDFPVIYRLEESDEQTCLNVVAECLSETIQKIGNHNFAMTLLSDDFIATTFDKAA
jgi:hypothetical protein